MHAIRGDIFRRRNLRSRLWLAWSVFAVASVATVFAVHRLYDTVRRELEEQSQLALNQQRTKAMEEIRARTEALRVATIKTLASFHVEGLAYSLRRWDESSTAVTGTFQWDPRQRFFAESAPLPKGMVANELAALWTEFRTRQTASQSKPATPASPAATTSAADGVESAGAYRARTYHLANNPSFPATELGYQAENLEMLAYAGRPADPWAGWAGAPRQPGAPWIFWYQAGPDAPVRGCYVDVSTVVTRLRAEIADRRLAQIDLVTSNDNSGELADVLPGYALTVEPGALFVEKQSAARLTALAALALLGVFLLGAVFLAAYSRHEVRDAERKATFVTQVSHELRTPLTSIRMFADMLGASELPSEKRLKFAGSISRESERLSGLIERLLTFAALEKGRHAVAIAPVDVAALLRETLEEMDATLRSAGMEVEPEIPAGQLMASTDRSTVKQALLNLLDNALKYARDGRVIRIALTGDADRVCVRVADCGPGIPGALTERVFEPFIQGEQTLTDKPPGVGLGLSIARGLLRAAGGDLVLLASERGALFEIRLAPATLS